MNDRIISVHDITHKVMLVKLTYTYHNGMSEFDLYEAVRGVWKASYDRASEVDYVFGIHEQTIVAVFKPDEWHYVRENIDIPRPHEIFGEVFEQKRDRIYFICNDYKQKDAQQISYLNKYIGDLKSSQNPITYING